MKALVISLAFFFLSTHAFSQNLEADSSKHPVYNYFLQGINDFNRHNLSGFVEQFADDIHMYTHAGWLRNKEVVRQRFADIFKQFPAIYMQMDSLNVRPVNDHTVIVDFSCRTFPQGKGPAFHMVGSGVYVWRNGRWWEVFEHETLVKTDPEMFARQ